MCGQESKWEAGWVVSGRVGRWMAGQDVDGWVDGRKARREGKKVGKYRHSAQCPSAGLPYIQLCASLHPTTGPWWGTPSCF